MTYWMLAIVLALASFAAVTCAVALALALIVRPLVRRIARIAPSTRAASCFVVRMLPLAIGLVAGFAIVLPIFLWFEPANTSEAIAPSLAVAAIGGACLLTGALRRGFLAWRATRALARTWRARADRVESVDAPLPVYAIDECYPIVAVVGFRRPELFISQDVLRECSADEVRAMVLHECAHVAARDNVKRLALRAAAGALPGARALDALWASAAEEAADAAAASSRPELGIDLAHALIRVARLALGAPAHVPASAFYSGGGIDARVRRLLDPPAGTRRRSPMGSASAGVAIGAVAAVLGFAPAVHDAIELVVRSLP